MKVDGERTRGESERERTRERERDGESEKEKEIEREKDSGREREGKRDFKTYKELFCTRKSKKQVFVETLKSQRQLSCHMQRRSEANTKKLTEIWGPLVFLPGIPTTRRPK